MDSNPSEPSKVPPEGEEDQNLAQSQAESTSRDLVDIATSREDRDIADETSLPAESAIADETPTTSGPIELPIIKEKRAGKIWLWSFLGVIVFILVSSGIYNLTNSSNPYEYDAKKAVVASPSVQPTATPGPLTASSAVNQVKTKLKGSLVTVAKTDASAGLRSDGRYIWSAPSYKVSGNKFSTLPTKAFGVGVTGDKETATADFDALNTFLANHSFTKVSSSDDLTQGGQSDVVYASKSVVCEANLVNLTDTTVKAYQASMGCADLSSYTEAAKAAQPFYDAYIEKHPDQSTNNKLSLGSPEIKSGSDGYKNATVNFPSWYELFYQAPGKDWVDFDGGQDTMGCDKFTTDILKKSFDGLACFDATTQKESVVKA